MAVRPIALLALLTFALLAGCSDGAPSGDLVAKGGGLSVDGSTAENTYVAESGGQANPVPGQDRICTTDPTGQAVQPCVEASSHYKVHFMSLPEPDGNGYAVFQVGGEIGERQLVPLTPTPEGMYEAEFTRDGVDESAMFERLELRMGSFVVASASSAQGSQAFVADAAFGNVTVTGSFKGHKLTLDVQGLPGDGSKPQFVGRLYTLNQAGNLTVAESFNVVNGAQEYVSKDANVGSYAEFHIHVGTSKVYVYQATLGEP
jgi:hypothetical protein